jgi:hypothetical protein
MAPEPNDDDLNPNSQEGQDQNDGGQDGEAEKEDLFLLGADALEAADYPEERVEQIRMSQRFQDSFSERRLRLIGEEDAALADRISEALEAEKAQQAKEERERKAEEALTDEQKKADEARQAALHDRDARKRQLAEERSKALSDKAEQDRLATLDAELSAELDEEDTETSPGNEFVSPALQAALDKFDELTEPGTNPVTGVETRVAKLDPKDPHGSLEQVAAAADEVLRLSQETGVGSAQEPIDFDPDDFLERFNKRLAERKEAR